MTDEEIQRKYCSNSRAAGTEKPGRMGKRLVRNILDAIPYFENYGKSTRLYDVGCGDGLGMQVFKDNAFTNVVGVEYVQERVDTAKAHKLDVFQGSADALENVILGNRAGNIFCSHTLEHVRNQGKALRELQRIAQNLVYILVPIEYNKKTSNAAHFSPVGDLLQLREQFSADWEPIRMEYRYNLENEGLLIMRRVKS